MSAWHSRQVQWLALTVFVSAMPIDGDIAAESAFRFCVVWSGTSHLATKEAAYRDLLAEEKPLLVANHPKGFRKLLPSISPVSPLESVQQEEAVAAYAWAVEMVSRLVQNVCSVMLAICLCHPMKPFPYSICCSSLCSCFVYGSASVSEVWYRFDEPVQPGGSPERSARSTRMWTRWWRSLSSQ